MIDDVELLPGESILISAAFAAEPKMIADMGDLHRIEVDASDFKKTRGGHKQSAAARPNFQKTPALFVAVDDAYSHPSMQFSPEHRADVRCSANVCFVVKV